MENINPIESIKRPDFELIIENFRNEVNDARELTNAIRYLIYNLKPFPDVLNPIPVKDSECIGVVDSLHKLIYGLKDNNDDLKLIIQHLNSIVGN